mmetsp:Transcript_173303/g.555866  ORF Transcript_173303/g.555866 Transcript_173303/m.555866 type:complete len:94 (+) Transcript_173303:509-790(+)
MTVLGCEEEGWLSQSSALTCCRVVIVNGSPRQHTQQISAQSEHPHRQHCFHRRTSRRCRCRGWVRVLWHNGQTNNYRVGCQGCHDLQLCQILD